MTAKALLIIAPVPPPYYGAAVATRSVLAAARRGDFRFYHVNIMDPAGTKNMGRLVPENFLLALKHYLQVIWALLRHRDIGAVYALISFTNAPAFWRDFGFLVLARIFRKPTILHCHDSMIGEFCSVRTRATRAGVRRALEGAEAVAVLCPGIRLVTERIAPRARVYVVANGLNLEQASSDPRTPRAGPPEPVVLYVSQLSEEKGFWTALRVAAHVKRLRADARFEFAGTWKSPADETRARQWIRENDLDSTVRIFHAVPDERKSELLQGADIFLFPTTLRHEGQPLVILEAMAAGLPVITTDIGCIADTVVHGVTGFVLKPSDFDAIVHTLSLLLQDTDLRRRMGEAAKARYLKDYTEQAFTRRMRALIGRAAPSVLAEPSAIPGHQSSAVSA